MTLTDLSTLEVAQGDDHLVYFTGLPQQDFWLILRALNLMQHQGLPAERIRAARLINALSVTLPL